LAVPRAREGGLRLAKIFDSALLQPARSVYVSSERFFIESVAHFSNELAGIYAAVCDRNVCYVSFDIRQLVS